MTGLPDNSRPVEYEVESCARCGSSLMFDSCEWCPATGWYDDFDPDCPECGGHGTVPRCLSTPEWCEAHPLPGRVDIARGTPEITVVACTLTPQEDPS